MDPPYFLKIERGDCSASGDSLYRIAKGLGISLHELFYEGLEADVEEEHRKWEEWMKAKHVDGEEDK